MATTSADGDARAELVAGGGEGSPARVRVYFGKNVAPAGEPPPLADVPVVGGGPQSGGVYVGLCNELPVLRLARLDLQGL